MTEGEIRAAWGRGDTLPEEVEVLLERLDERTEERDRCRDAKVIEIQRKDAAVVEIAALREQVNLFKAQHQDEIGLNGMREERDNAMALAKAALLARMQEPDVIAAGRRAIMEATNCHLRDECPDCPKGDRASCQEILRTALTKIAEMLK